MCHWCHLQASPLGGRKLDENFDPPQSISNGKFVPWFVRNFKSCSVPWLDDLTSSGNLPLCWSPWPFAVRYSQLGSRRSLRAGQQSWLAFRFLQREVAMHIVEAVLEDTTGLNYIFYRMDERLLLDLLKTLKSLIVCIRSQRSYLCMGQAAKPLCVLYIRGDLSGGRTSVGFQRHKKVSRFPLVSCRLLVAARQLPLVSCRSSVCRCRCRCRLMIAGRPSPFGARPSPLAHRRSPLFVAYPLLFILILRLKINTWLLC
ncbi:hypothetical protein H6P81_017343 [Aristolochia fimbriata]|uniref:Uncharacterized protein n=1 Tax=Aristolochia fimbriata TaxID=158543 RepID=A0AAV7DZM8_ARIFI|nr:hypothetical protein H6P81_017343 [Aristolochia fimbriata]